MAAIPKARTIAEQWDEFEKVIIIPNNIKLDSVQYRETRRAFYAGFHAALIIGLSFDNSISEEAGTAILEGLHEECRVFAKRIHDGQA